MAMKPMMKKKSMMRGAGKVKSPKKKGKTNAKSKTRK